MAICCSTSYFAIKLQAVDKSYDDMVHHRVQCGDWEKGSEVKGISRSSGNRTNAKKDLKQKSAVLAEIRLKTFNKI